MPEVRIAGALDEPKLRRLARECPMLGAVAYRVEREPDFFALTRLQGSEPAFAVIDAPDGASIAAMATSVSISRRLRGEVERLRYWADLKVHPRHQRRGYARRLMELAREQLVRERTAAIGLVLGGNRSMGALIGRRGAGLHFERLATLRSYDLFIGGSSGRMAPACARELRDSELEEVAALFNRCGRARVLTPGDRDADALRQELAALGAHRALVVARSGRITAFAAVWDPAPVKQVRLLGLPRHLRWLRRIYDPVARRMGRPTIPADAELLRFVYVTRFCAESPGDLYALLMAVRDRLVGSPYLYLDIALDVRDPLTAALDPFFKTTVNFELHLVTPSGTVAPSVDGRPIYFDLANA